MSVTGQSANTTAIQRLSELELKKGIVGEGSWHHQYRDSCYIFIGGLDTRMTEGDIIIVFSQFGEPIDINLKRDKATGRRGTLRPGKSLGYCFLGYRDQRSTILAVDNFNGSTLLGRRIRVDHVMDYKAPVIYEDEVFATQPLQPDEEGNKVPKEYQPTGAEGSGIDKYFVTQSEQLLKETARARKSPPRVKEMDEDERWAMEFEKSLRNDEEYGGQSTSSKHGELERTPKTRSRDRRDDGDTYSGRRRYRSPEGKHRREQHRSSRSSSGSRGRGYRRSRSRDRHRRRDRQHHREIERSRSRSEGRHRSERHRKNRRYRSHSR